MEKIRINGLKFSSKLTLLQLEPSPSGAELLVDLYRLLGDHQINILFVSTTTESDQKHGVCCIEYDEQSRAEALIGQHSTLSASIRMISGVGLLTLYPHQSRLKIVGVVLQSLGENDIPIYGLASSIASISVVTDYDRLDEAADALSACLELPQNAAPARSVLKVKQVDVKE